MPQKPDSPRVPPEFTAGQEAKPRRVTDWGSLPLSGGPLHAVDAVLNVSRIRPVTLTRTTPLGERHGHPPSHHPEATNHDAEHLRQVAQVLERAQQRWGSEQAALAWLRAPHTALSGATPLSLMVTDGGLAQVLHLLDEG